MRIVIDHEIDDFGNKVGEHCIHTEANPPHHSADPANPGKIIDPIDFVAMLHKGTVPLAGTGWDIASKHPLYPGKHRLDVFRAEIVRLNDARSRAKLGV